MNDKMYTQQMTDLAHHAMNRIKELEHRLAMVMDDQVQLRKFIYANGLGGAFEQPTETSDEAWALLNNIEIACDLDSTECLSWTKYSK
jgi:hypothetical protein